MSHQLTLEVPDEVYQSLADEAATAGKTVAEVAGERLAQATPTAKPGDLLRSICGIIETGPTDGSIRVDEYLGQAHLEQLQGGRND